MFTIQHYEPIAKIIGCTLLSNKWSSDDVRIQMFLYILADYFQEDNPKFDDNKFLEVCGYEQ